MTTQAKRILIVDDDDQIRNLLRTVLESHGYAVRHAANGLEAAKLAEAETPDLVITDIFMPEADGFEVLAVIKKSHPEIPVIVVSGSQVTPNVDFLHLAGRLGAYSVLHKPFRPQQLVEAVETALANPSGRS
ncbi:MAG TPA: response regulator [Dongiaceae bacterium]|jgi:DNA-binding NtrC family response regulator|nr:response regulator [Dongiaceae bacterium]